MKEKLIEIIKKHCAIEEEITEDSRLASMSIDSLSFIGILVDLENEFNIEFGFEELTIGQWETVRDIKNYIQRKYSEEV